MLVSVSGPLHLSRKKPPHLTRRVLMYLYRQIHIGLKSIPAGLAMRTDSHAIDQNICDLHAVCALQVARYIVISCYHWALSGYFGLVLVLDRLWTDLLGVLNSI